MIFSRIKKYYSNKNYAFIDKKNFKTHNFFSKCFPFFLVKSLKIILNLNFPTKFPFSFFWKKHFPLRKAFRRRISWEFVHLDFRYTFQAAFQIFPQYFPSFFFVALSSCYWRQIVEFYLLFFVNSGFLDFFSVHELHQQGITPTSKTKNFKLNKGNKKGSVKSDLINDIRKTSLLHFLNLISLLSVISSLKNLARKCL